MGIAKIIVCCQAQASSKEHSWSLRSIKLLVQFRGSKLQRRGHTSPFSQTTHTNHTLLGSLINFAPSIDVATIAVEGTAVAVVVHFARLAKQFPLLPSCGNALFVPFFGEPCRASIPKSGVCHNSMAVVCSPNDRSGAMALSMTWPKTTAQLPSPT